MLNNNASFYSCCSSWNMLLSEINKFSDNKTILSKTLLQDNLRLFEESFLSV